MPPLTGSAETTNIWQAFPDPDQFAALLNDMEGGRTNRFILQNNNPGNLKDSSGNFVKFGSWEEGRQALLNRMRDWQQRFPNMTIAEFNHRYAPDKSHGGDNADGTEAGRNQRMLSAMSQGVAASSRGPQGQSGQFTIPEFAARVRAQLPQLSQAGPISDPELVRLVLEQRPDLLQRIQTMARRPGAPKGPTGIMTPPPPTSEQVSGELWGRFWDQIARSGQGLISPDEMARREITQGPYAGKTVQQLREMSERPPSLAESPQPVRQGGVITSPQAGTHIPLFGNVNMRSFTPGLLAREAEFTSGMTSPQAIATAPLAAAGRVPGPIGQVARGVLSGQGLAYTAGGLEDMYRGVSEEGGVLSPQGMEQFLTGAAALPYGEYLGRRWGAGAPQEVLSDIDTRLQGLGGQLLSLSPRFREHLQEIAGAGLEPVEKALGEAKTYNDEQVRQHRENELNKMINYQEKLQKYLQDKAEGKQGNLKELRDSKKAWTDAQRAHSQAAQQNVRIARDQQAVATRTRDYVKRAMNNVYRTYQAGQADFDYRWASLREAIRTRLGGPREFGGRPNPRYGAIDSERIQAVMNRATASLMGSPENLTQFRQLTNFMTPEGGAGAELDANGKPRLRDLQWDEGLRYHNVLDKAKRSESTAGVVRNALETVQREALEPELARVAGLARMDRTYAQLNRDYSQWLTDWRDPGPVSTGASPLRDAVERKDALTFLGDVTKGIGEDVEGPGHRMVKDFAKYRKYGADPNLLTGIQNLALDARKIKTVRVPEPPGMYKAPTSKQLPTRPTFEPPKPPQVRQVDPVQIRRDILRAYAGRPMIPSEVGRIRHPLYRFYKRVLKSPSVRERVARQPRQEIQP